LPFGVVYKACNLLPTKLLIVSVREVHRARQIHAGFIYASSKFPNCAFIIAVYAVILGLYNIDYTSTTSLPPTVLLLSTHNSLFNTGPG